MKTLLVEDSHEIVEAVSMVFQMRWPEVTILTTAYGEKAVTLAKEESPDLVILDLGLPDIDGFQVLRRIREFSEVPVIILTVQPDEINKIKGLELGADDYVVKPFSPGELLARARAVTRRRDSMPSKNETLKNLAMFGKLRIDTGSREVSIGGKSVKLSPRAYDLLTQLLARKGDIVPIETLMQAVSAPGDDPSQAQIIFLVNRINKDLSEGTGFGQVISGDPVAGYRISAL